MQRRTFIKTSAAIPILAPMATEASPNRECGEPVLWKVMAAAAAGVPTLNGYTDTVPDIAKTPDAATAAAAARRSAPITVRIGSRDLRNDICQPYHGR
jgi:hypothetical protein